MVQKKVGLPGSSKRSKAGLNGEQKVGVDCMHMMGLKLIPVPNKWTMAHGHLVVMGGIITVDPSVEDDGQVDPRSPLHLNDIPRPSRKEKGWTESYAKSVKRTSRTVRKATFSPN